MAASKVGGLNGTSILVLAAGAAILTAGLTNNPISKVLHSWLQGDLPASTQDPAVAATIAQSQGTTGSGVTYSPGENSGSFGGSYNQLNGEQVAKYAYDAGFRGQSLINMVAIAKRESGWDPMAHNTNAGTGDNSYGLWQINMLGSLGPARRMLLGLSSNDQLFSPAVNARAAWIISGMGTNFTPWSTWRGLSQADLNAAAQAVHAAGLG